MKQADAESRFQSRNSIAHGCGREAEFIRCAAKALASGDSKCGLQADQARFLHYPDYRINVSIFI
jgi:hypothetical protein